MERVKKIYKGELTVDSNIDGLVSFKIGGRCRWITFPESEEEIISLVRFCRENEIPYYVIGKGTNLLMGSDPFEGMILYLGRNLDHVEQRETPEGVLITAAAGIPLSKLGHICREQGLGGFEYLSFIPGTLGGGLITNAEAHQASIGERVIRVKVLDGEVVRWIDGKDCGFTYRSSVFEKHPEWIILSVELLLKPMDRALLDERWLEAKSFRNQKQPKKPSAGSVFKNPKGKPAGWLLDQAGLKGLRSGDAVVSEIHANFILNEGHATSGDVLTLMETMRRKVEEMTGIELEPELKIFNC